MPCVRILTVAMEQTEALEVWFRTRQAGPTVTEKVFDDLSHVLFLRVKLADQLATATLSWPPASKEQLISKVFISYKQDHNALTCFLHHLSENLWNSNFCHPTQRRMRLLILRGNLLRYLSLQIRNLWTTQRDLEIVRIWTTWHSGLIIHR